MTGPERRSALRRACYAEPRHIAMHGRYVLSELGIARGEHGDEGEAVIEAAVVLDEQHIRLGGGVATPPSSAAK